ncbi:MAG: DUF4363 family protein [Ruminococcaceae bacterium]|nr:DUF4363 family protein [Oscillospiraceae bacterium]
MLRLWIGIGILAILLAMGIGLLWGSGVFFEELSQDLQQAGDFALAGNWQAAGEKVEKSREKWEAYRPFWASFTDHEPVEQMQNLFSQLELYRARQLEVEFAAVCRNLVHVAEAIDEAHGLRWWSVL